MTDDVRARRPLDDTQAPIPSNSTADRLLAGAANLFHKKGYAGTTTRELSALVGIQNASLYHHVGGKEDLLYRLCVKTLDDVAETFAAARSLEEGPLATLERLARDYVQLSLRDRDRHATMLSELRSLSERRREEIIARRDENVRVVRDVIRAGQESGQIRSDISDKYLALAMFNLLNWSIFWFSPDGDLSPEQLGEILWTIFSTGTLAGGRGPAGRAGRGPATRKTRKLSGTASADGRTKG